MINFINYWKDFRAFPYSDEILIVLGAMVLIVSILRIVKSSFKTLMWVLLSGFGLTSIFTGLDNNPFVSAVAQHGTVENYIGAGKEISSDALDILCRKLEETELLQLEQNLN